MAEDLQCRNILALINHRKFRGDPPPSKFLFKENVFEMKYQKHDDE